MTPVEAGEWAFWPDSQETVRILEVRSLWEREAAQVLGRQGNAQWVPVEQLADPHHRTWAVGELEWRAAAGKAAHLMAKGQPVAISLGKLDPLPHQLGVLDRALAADPVRLLLADEVGLGKTIEAGLIYGELKARKRVKRVVVIAPKGVQLQWVAEMRERFGEEFALVGPGGIPVDAGVDPWQAFDRVVCSIDSVKPIGPRSGLSLEETEKRNEARFKRMVDAGWDLAIIDEAHHAAGASLGVARHELAAALAATVPHVLLLTATPHSGKADAFARLMSLIEPRFLDSVPVNATTIAPYLVRNEKRSVVDQRGASLFQPRTTSLERVPYRGRDVEQQLYEAITQYVRHGYTAGRGQRGSGAILLLLLMQRLASSSTAAILDALGRRMASLVYEGQLRFFPESAEAWGDLSGEEQVELLATAKGAAWGDERAELEILIELARRAIADGPDAKARHLLDLLGRIQREESDPSVKLVVFTQFVATQEMLLVLLEAAGIETVVIYGGMDIEERRLAQDEFRARARVLVSTDAGGEGINLQFAHVVVNYDLPWNPMRIEQRVGRVDRIGQDHPVKAFNLVLENSIDQRVIEIFERKLSLILAQVGIDKRDDVLETVANSKALENQYMTALADPEALGSAADELEAVATREVNAESGVRGMLRAEPARTPKSSDATHWAERALERHQSERGLRMPGIAELIDVIPDAPGVEAIAVMRGSVDGIWSLWEVSPDASGPHRDFFALFVEDGGRLRPDLADRIWTDVASGRAEVVATHVLDGESRARVEAAGIDYGYRACLDLEPDGSWAAPVVSARLLVRTTG